jgi:CRISPR-associated endoribonuclease Cas6
VTSLDHTLSRYLLDPEIWVGRPLRIGKTEFCISGMLTSPRESWLCSSVTFGEIANNGMAIARRARNALLVRLRFLSPTTFRLAESRLMMPLPLPHLVFQSLEQKWNTFAYDGIWIDWPEFDRCVSIATHRLRTASVNMGGYRQVGFVGNVEYIIDRDVPPKMLEAIHILAGFARYAGVGAKTTMGMGVAVSPDQWESYTARASQTSKGGPHIGESN